MTTNSSYTTQNDLLLKNLLVFYDTNENDNLEYPASTLAAPIIAYVDG